MDMGALETTCIDSIMTLVRTVRRLQKAYTIVNMYYLAHAVWIQENLKPTLGGSLTVENLTTLKYQFTEQMENCQRSDNLNHHATTEIYIYGILGVH